MKQLLSLLLVINFYFFTQAQDSINNLGKVESKDTVTSNTKKLWFYFTPFSLGTRLNSNKILVGTHLSINMFLKKHFSIAIKTDAISELLIFQNNEDIWTIGTICSYYSKMKKGHLDAGIGLSYISGKYSTGIVESSGWFATTYYMKSIRSVGLDFRFIRTYLLRKKNIGIGIMGNINKHISFINLGITAKVDNFFVKRSKRYI